MNHFFFLEQIMPPLRAVVFDLDDTLYPERSYVLSGFHAVAIWAEEQLGIARHSGFAVFKQLFETGVRGNSFDQWLDMFGLASAERVQQMIDVYREHIPEIVPFPDVRGMLTTLRSSYRLGLVTDGYLSVQQRKLEALGIRCYFDGVVFSDELGPSAWKPSPQPFLLMSERLGVSASAAVYIADNPQKDFLGARRAGLGSVRIRHVEGLHARREPISMDYASDLEITTFAQVYDALRSMEKTTHG